MSDKCIVCGEPMVNADFSVPREDAVTITFVDTGAGPRTGTTEAPIHRRHLKTIVELKETAEALTFVLARYR